MKKINCSVPILTLNSGDYLERCLKSVVDFSDVFLLDGNSTDNTRAIAERYGVPVYKQVDTDQTNIAIKNFTAMRQKAEQLTAGDWILFLDSDEFLSDDLIAEIATTLKNAADEKTAFAIQKNYVVKTKKIEHAFNYPNYMIRLYNKKSGVAFKQGKLVHEQLAASAAVAVRRLQHCYYSQLPASYRECVEKDAHQLVLMKVTTLRAAETRVHALKMAFIYALRAANIIRKSLFIYTRFGYDASLPLGQVMRHVRNHLLMSYWRAQKVLARRKI